MLCLFFLTGGLFVNRFVCYFVVISIVKGIVARMVFMIYSRMTGTRVSTRIVVLSIVLVFLFLLIRRRVSIVIVVIVSFSGMAG